MNWVDILTESSLPNKTQREREREEEEEEFIASWNLTFQNKLTLCSTPSPPEKKNHRKIHLLPA